MPALNLRNIRTILYNIKHHIIQKTKVLPVVRYIRACYSSARVLLRRSAVRQLEVVSAAILDDFSMQGESNFRPSRNTLLIYFQWILMKEPIRILKRGCTAHTLTIKQTLRHLKYIAKRCVIAVLAWR